MHVPRIAITLFSLCLLLPCACAQAARPGAHSQANPALKQPVRSTVSVTVLKKVATYKFQSPGATSVLDWSYCDDQGDVYLQYTSVRPRLGLGPIMPPSPVGEPITELSTDSQGISKFPAPTVSGYGPLTLDTFSLDWRGRLYGLYSARRSPLAEGSGSSERDLLVKFGHHGGVDSVTALERPPVVRFVVTHIVAFADGNLLATGNTEPPLPRGENWVPRLPSTHRRTARSAPSGFGPFTGIFDSQGQFLQEMKLPGDVRPGASSHAVPETSGPGKGQNDAVAPTAKAGQAGTAAPAPREPHWLSAVIFTVMIAGPQDTVYLLRASSPPQLYVLSSDGRVLRHVRIRPPAPNLVPTNISWAGRSDLLISFGGNAFDRPGRERFIQILSLVDPATGKLLAAYKLPKRSDMTFACAAGANDFLFVGSSRHGKLEVGEYSGH